MLLKKFSILLLFGRVKSEYPVLYAFWRVEQSLLNYSSGSGKITLTPTNGPSNFDCLAFKEEEDEEES